MTETENKRPLFRPEAVEHHLRGRVTGRTLDLREGRTAWLFRGLLVALVVLLLVAATIRVNTQATVPVVVEEDGRSVVATVSRKPNVVVVSVEIDGRPVRTQIDIEGQQVRMLLDEEFRPGTRGIAMIDLGDASVLDLILGRD